MDASAINARINEGFPVWLRAKKNKHVCLPQALVEDLQSDPDLKLCCEKSMVYVLEELAVVDDSFDRGQPGDWDISKQIYEGSRSTYLHFAVKLMDVPFVCECIRLGIDVNCQDIKGRTPLFSAMEQIVGYLFDVALRKETEDTSSRPMISALRSLRLIVKILLEQGAEIYRTPWDARLAITAPPPALAWTIPDIELLELFALYGASDFITRILADLEPSPDENPMWANNPTKVSAFRDLVARLLRDGPPPRPPRRCPCLSGKTLSECHGLGPQAYPPHFPCVCGLSKTYETCCRRRGIDFMERWDENKGRLVVVCRVTDGQSVIYQRPCLVSPLLFEGEVSELDKEKRKEVLMMAINQNDTTSGEKADPAFRYAATKFEFLPRPMGDLRTRDVGKYMSGIWNGCVDEYIARGTDSRSALVIERAAKLDPCYGPLWKRCEASGCAAVEGPRFKMKCCAACKRAYYCGAPCQKAHWKEHRLACKRRDHPLQALRSQEIYGAIIDEAIKAEPGQFDNPSASTLENELEDFNN